MSEMPSLEALPEKKKKQKEEPESVDAEIIQLFPEKSLTEAAKEDIKTIVALDQKIADLEIELDIVHEALKTGKPWHLSMPAPTNPIVQAVDWVIIKLLNKLGEGKRLTDDEYARLGEGRVSIIHELAVLRKDLDDRIEKLPPSSKGVTVRLLPALAKIRDDLRGDVEKPQKQLAESAVENKAFIEAREILGNNMFGPLEVALTFGFHPEKVPPIPYSREDLEKAKELGEMLILRMDKDADGNPLTIQRIQEITAPSWRVSANSDQSYINEDTPRLEWKLVSMNVLPESIGKAAIEQTAILRDYLAKNGLATPEELAECTDELLQKIRYYMKYSRKDLAIDMLSNLLINKNHRRQPVDAFYDLKVARKNGTPHLAGSFDLTVRRGDAKSEIVAVSDVVSTWDAENGYTGFGVCSSH